MSQIKHYAEKWTDELGEHEVRVYLTGDPLEAALPHSCDEWTIGSKDDVRALITDLQALLDDWRKK